MDISIAFCQIFLYPEKHPGAIKGCMEAYSNLGEQRTCLKAHTGDRILSLEHTLSDAYFLLRPLHVDVTLQPCFFPSIQSLRIIAY